MSRCSPSRLARVLSKAATNMSRGYVLACQQPIFQYQQRGLLHSCCVSQMAHQQPVTWQSPMSGQLQHGGPAQLLLCAQQHLQLPPLFAAVMLKQRQGFAAHYASKSKGGANKGANRSSGGRDRGGAQDADDASTSGTEAEYEPAPFELLMKQAIEHFSSELAGVRTGRAAPGLIENLLVIADGDHRPVKACGAVTVRNPQLLVVSLYDAALSKPVEKAIRDSPLALNPSTEGSEVMVKLPRMTQDAVQRLIKLVGAEAERAHQSVRRARQSGMDAIKAAFKHGSQDERKRAEKALQRLHDQYVAEVERLKKLKDVELREHRD